MNIDLITIIALAIFGLGVYMRNCALQNRVANLETELRRKDAIQRAHLAVTDELLATMRELERYNASLEQQLQRERIVQLHRRVEWSMN